MKTEKSQEIWEIYTASEYRQTTDDLNNIYVTFKEINPVYAEDYLPGNGSGMGVGF